MAVSQEQVLFEGVAEFDAPVELLAIAALTGIAVSFSTDTEPRGQVVVSFSLLKIAFAQQCVVSVPL